MDKILVLQAQELDDAHCDAADGCPLPVRAGRYCLSCDNGSVWGPHVSRKDNKSLRAVVPSPGTWFRS